LQIYTIFGQSPTNSYARHFPSPDIVRYKSCNAAFTLQLHCAIPSRTPAPLRENMTPKYRTGRRNSTERVFRLLFYAARIFVSAIRKQREGFNNKKAANPFRDFGILEENKL
jgi:hypothetical protein